MQTALTHDLPRSAAAPTRGPSTASRGMDLVLSGALLLLLAPLLLLALAIGRPVRQPAWGRRGAVVALDVPAGLIRSAPHRLRRARARPAAVEPPRGRDFTERLDAVLGANRGRGGVAERVPAEEAARRILALLAREGFGPAP